ncbi:FAD-dependent oxidoreductase [Streptantibioticus parmotrematis]|uniref:NAD(P)/FAD-dependent oxidoreductase n=1 Tax=Streptantibioticus parmotrematis TaxID=2873249 RepID=UPI0033D429D0
MTGTRIVVLGAGYAGIAAATRAGRGRDVTLIAPESRFLHRVRGHETAAGHREHRPALAELLRGRNVTHLQAAVTRLDLTAGKVFTDTGDAVAYDTLVYALGSRTAWQDVPGAREHALDVARAEEVRRRIAAAPAHGTVAVVGGGPTGIELAAELAEAHPDLRVELLASGEVGGWLSDAGRRHVLRVLDRLGVRRHEHTRVTAVGPAGLETEAGPLAADVVVWAASMTPHPLAAESGLTVTGQGQVVVDEYLRSVSHPEVHAIGDAASVTVPGVGTLRMGCATALPMGQYLGKRLLRGDSGPFSYRYVAQCLSLGRHDGLLQIVGPDDSMRPRVFTGTAGRLAKAGIVMGVRATLR